MSCSRSLKRFVVALSLLAVPVFGQLAHGQSYPSKPVRILSPNAPGGPSDTALRGIAEVLGKALGEPFVVENRPGGEGIISGEACARAAPDGYTLCLADSFHTVLNPALRAKMPYDPARDLTPVIHIGFLPSGFWVQSAIPANSIKEFVELAKAKPSTINFASWGRSSTPYLYVELFKTKERVLFSDIPYKSAVNAWQAVFTGEADATIYGVRAGLPQMKAGKVKLLAVNTDARLPDLPDTPTFTEAGLQPSLIVWFALFAPSATPKEIVQRINAEVVKGLYNNPELRERYLSSQGMLIYGPAGGSTDAASEFVRSQSSMYGELMRAANVSPQ